MDTAEKAARTRKPSIIEREDQSFRRKTPKVGLVSLEKLAAVFSRSQNQQLPAGVEPGSIEAMKHCGYLRGRDFNPGADIVDEVPKARKTSRTMSDDRESVARSRRSSQSRL